ncbi:MAG: pseudouridine synthase, partial [Hymenobacteraceae bacterium]|nr:pseudouridine synthase [Hymenobacteraceae bacterium]
MEEVVKEDEIRNELEILYRDEHYVAINKPGGLLVHRTRIAEEDKRFALQMLRNQLGQHVYPVHRLDRQTAGVLVFALNSEA